MEVLTEVSTSGLAWNVLQGLGAINPPPNLPTTTQTKGPLLPLFSLQPTFHFCRCIIHIHYIMLD